MASNRNEPHRGSSGQEKKSEEDMIIYLNGKYYYLPAHKLKDVATTLDPQKDLTASRAEALRSRGALLAHMDEESTGVGYWSTLINLDAVIAGEHATRRKP